MFLFDAYVINPQPTIQYDGYLGWSKKKGCTFSEVELAEFAPYKVDDVPWVRETWARISDWTDVDPSGGAFDGFIFKADWGGSEAPKWKPSIYMPRKAARLFLRVTGVRVERLKDVSEADAVSEGVFYDRDGDDYRKFYHVDKETPCNTSRAKFAALWNKLNAERDGGLYAWNKNPFVWVSKFERIGGKNVYGQ